MRRDANGGGLHCAAALAEREHRPPRAAIPWLENSGPRAASQMPSAVGYRSRPRLRASGRPQERITLTWHWYSITSIRELYACRRLDRPAALPPPCALDRIPGIPVGLIASLVITWPGILHGLARWTERHRTRRLRGYLPSSRSAGTLKCAGEELKKYHRDPGGDEAACRKTAGRAARAQILQGFERSAVPSSMGGLAVHLVCRQHVPLGKETILHRRLASTASALPAECGGLCQVAGGRTDKPPRWQKSSCGRHLLSAAIRSSRLRKRAVRHCGAAGRWQEKVGSSFTRRGDLTRPGESFPAAACCSQARCRPGCPARRGAAATGQEARPWIAHSLGEVVLEVEGELPQCC